MRTFLWVLAFILVLLLGAGAAVVGAALVLTFMVLCGIAGLVCLILGAFVQFYWMCSDAI